MCWRHSQGTKREHQGAAHSQAGGWFSRKVFIGDKPGEPNVLVPRVYWAITDKLGTTLFQIPSSDGKTCWPGIERKRAAMELPATFAVPPATSPCGDPKQFCASFMPTCPTNDPGEYENFNCELGAGLDGGRCDNFLFNEFVNTGNTWGSTKAFDGAVDWTLEMESP